MGLAAVRMLLDTANTQNTEQVQGAGPQMPNDANPIA